ncbi:mechanosensitive ion channel family protein [Fundidesulfovibrio agrisoli]|uniref:mechanosensitive ion channel family protein n=1 Tax=Fundidesulfovibrio agrisoli TaxID=2922717 RepID=UPI001FADCBC9|nr:mechanosensitive ion channel family protein [Fundidesulfovibrio agrisoli]
MEYPLMQAMDAISHASYTVLAAIAALAALSVAMHLLQLRYSDKGAAGALAFGKWLAALGALRLLESRVFMGLFQAPAYALYVLLAWLAFRAFLHDVYGGMYMARIKGRPANKILLSLISFMGMLALAGLGLHGILGVDVGSLMTSSAILTAVVGLSMQDTIGSLFSGLLIQTEKPFQVGDWIKVGDQEGQVAEITWRYTKLVTFTQNQVLIPNNAIAKERLQNISQPIPQVSVVVNLPAPLHAPPVKVMSALEDVLRRSRLVAPLPAPRVRLIEIGQDHMLFRATFYATGFEDTVAARSEVLAGTWYEFRKLGIEFPAPRRVMLKEQERPCPHPPADVVKLLGGSGLFAGMHNRELELLAEFAGMRAYLPGSSIVTRGQSGTTMFIIADGGVSVRVGEKELATLGPGDMFGEMALLTGEPRSADVVATQNTTCLEIDREAFRTVLEHNQSLMDNITRIFKAREQANRKDLGSREEAAEEGLFERFRKIFW